MATAYRTPDAQRLHAAELERLEEQLRVAREHAADLDLVRQMRSPWRALGRAVPRGTTRTALLASCAAVVFPFAMIFLAAVATPIYAVASLAAFVAGASLGVAGCVLGIRALCQGGDATFAKVVAILLGVGALPWSAVCAVVADFVGRPWAFM